MLPDEQGLWPLRLLRRSLILHHSNRILLLRLGNIAGLWTLNLEDVLDAFDGHLVGTPSNGRDSAGATLAIVAGVVEHREAF
jgi:hypothetical protein